MNPYSVKKEGRKEEGRKEGRQEGREGGKEEKRGGRGGEGGRDGERKTALKLVKQIRSVQLQQPAGMWQGGCSVVRGLSLASSLS